MCCVSRTSCVYAWTFLPDNRRLDNLGFFFGDAVLTLIRLLAEVSLFCSLTAYNNYQAIFGYDEINCNALFDWL